MKAVLQRVGNAKVTIENLIQGQISFGILVLVGFSHADNSETLDWMVKKILNLRIFNDEEGKMNLSVQDVKGELLIISNFTLYADARKGTRPGYGDAAKPEIAKELYEMFLSKLKTEANLKVQSGIFGADMKVDLMNDGPVTIILEKEIDKNK